MRIIRRLLALTGVSILIMGGTVFAANTPDLTQTINAGTLATDILDASRNAVVSPSAALSAQTFSFDCQYGGSASTGALGANNERIYVMNPDAADNGWTLTIAATGGATTRWANAGVSQFFDFNDPTGANPGCDDGVDADTSAGQLTIDANAGTLTADCASCVTTNVTKGSSAAFSQGVVDSVTLLNAAAASNDVWRGYLTGATLSQTLPAEQAVDSYTINLTLTATAQ